MKEKLLQFFNYFFGKGDVEEFRYFGLAHLFPIIILGVILFLIIKYRDQLAQSKREEKNRIIMSVIMIVAEMSYFWRLLHSAPVLTLFTFWFLAQASMPSSHLPF